MIVTFYGGVLFLGLTVLGVEIVRSRRRRKPSQLAMTSARTIRAWKRERDAMGFRR